LIDHFGIGPSQIGLLLACQALCLVATWLMTAGWPASRRWLAVLAMAGLAHFYGAHRIFQVMEPFATARTLAEPLALLALAALLRGRLAWAAVALAGATACHPLVALPAALVGWVFLVLQHRRWAWLALRRAPIVALAVAGVEPFARLLQRYDETWFAVTVYSSSDVFVSEWARRDFTLRSPTRCSSGWHPRSRRTARAPVARQPAGHVRAVPGELRRGRSRPRRPADAVATLARDVGDARAVHPLAADARAASWQRGPAGPRRRRGAGVRRARARAWLRQWLGLALWTLVWLEVSRREGRALARRREARDVRDRRHGRRRDGLRGLWTCGADTHA
jgi:hypothetical protein